MNLLLTNDDGIDADGLRALASAAAGLGEMTVFAPAGHQSGCSHAVTTGRSVAVERRGEGRFAVHGTPADCVRVGLHGKPSPETWVLAGINHGGNLGADVHYSGTVAAVREAVLHGWPGIAFSHYRRKNVEYDWDRAARMAGRVLRELLASPWEPGTFWNVNLPHLDAADPDPASVICPLDPHPLPLSFSDSDAGLLYDGNYHARARIDGGDVDVCFNGRIAVTKIRLL